jgi:hypothetical protein
MSVGNAVYRKMIDDQQKNAVYIYIYIRGYASTGESRRAMAT